MTDSEYTHEIHVRRGRVQALEMAKAMNAGDPEAAHAIFTHETEHGAVDALTAGAAQMLLSVVRGYASLTDSTPAALIDHLWQQESSAIVVLHELDNLPTTKE